VNCGNIVHNSLVNILRYNYQLCGSSLAYVGQVTGKLTFVVGHGAARIVPCFDSVLGTVISRKSVGDGEFYVTETVSATIEPQAPPFR
jgi:hypothetical protein